MTWKYGNACIAGILRADVRGYQVSIYSKLERCDVRQKKCCDWRRIGGNEIHRSTSCHWFNSNWHELGRPHIEELVPNIHLTSLCHQQAFIDARNGKLVRCNAPCCSVAWMDKFLGPSFQRQVACVSLVNMVVWAMQWKGIDGLPTMNGAMARRRWTAIQQHDWYGCICVILDTLDIPSWTLRMDPWLNRCLNRIENWPWN